MRPLLIALGLAVAIAGCGKKGNPIRPPDIARQERPDVTPDPGTVAPATRQSVPDGEAQPLPGDEVDAIGEPIF